MLQQNELVMLFLGLAVLVFVLKNRETIKRYPYSRLLLISFYINVVSWVSTVAETYWLNSYLNFLEHTGYFLGALLFLAWILTLTTNTREIQ